MKKALNPIANTQACRPLLAAGAAKNLNRLNAQRGAALVISLVILISMTLLGITTMKSATTEFTMVGNLREAAITFQAAELALMTGERSLETKGTPANMLQKSATEPNYLDASSWTGDSVTKVDATTLANIPKDNNPSYITKHLAEWDPDKGTEGTRGFGGVDSVATAQRINYYRITARGLGQTGNTSRTVQSFYGVEVKTN